MAVGSAAVAAPDLQLPRTIAEKLEMTSTENTVEDERIAQVGFKAR